MKTELTENENEQIEQKWNIIKQAVIEAATETTDEEKRTRNDKECKEAIRGKNKDRLCMLQRRRQTYDKHKESRKKANKIICSKKKAFFSERK
jgi:hypothetical protein